MTFEGQYLTYAEYQTLGGSAIGEMPFNLLEFEARRQIDIRTSNRLKNLDNMLQEVKLCDKKLIDVLLGYSQTAKNISANGGKASESTDGYSVSYLNATSVENIIKSKRKELEDIIRSYLLGVAIDGEHIMYCGIR